MLINTSISTDALEANYSNEIEKLHSKINTQAVTLAQLSETSNSDLTDPKDRLYDFILNQTKIISVELKTRNNHLWVDGSPTDLYLLYPDQSTLNSRMAQKNKIKQKLTQLLQSQSDIPPIVLFTLTEDGSVFRYAYLLVQESISELTRELGADRFFLITNP
jgi:hypothetical protein